MTDITRQKRERERNHGTKKGKKGNQKLSRRCRRRAARPPFVCHGVTGDGRRVIGAAILCGNIITLNQGCPNLRPGAFCGPPSVFLWRIPRLTIDTARVIIGSFGCEVRQNWFSIKQIQMCAICKSNSNSVSILTAANCPAI